MRGNKIQFGSKEIAFDIKYQERRTLGITVHSDRNVTIKAPLETTLEIVKDKVRKRAPWILKQQSYFLTFEPRTPKRKFVGGETHLYLGRQYRLKIINNPIESVKLMRGYLEVHTSHKSNVKPLLLKWYSDQATKKFPQYAAPWINRFSLHGVEPTSIVIQWMKKRWGSCTPSGKIILNTELIKAPRACIEYVIVHELCHLVHHNHTQKFIDLQTKEFPGWEKWKMKLEVMLV